MKNLGALVSVSLVVGVYALGACNAGKDIIFIDPPEDPDTTGAGGSGSATTGGVGGDVIAGTTTTGIGSSSVSTGAGGSGSGSGNGGGPAFDCANIPKGPLSYTVKSGGFKAYEDMDFDNEGNLVGHSNGNLFKSNFNGQSTIWVPGIQDSTAGTRFTSKGVLVYANVSSAALYKIDPPNIKTFLIGGLSYPNGMDADNVGRITVAEESASQVRRVNPETGEFDILATGLNEPNGVSYSPDYKSIYVGSFGGNVIYKIVLDAQDKPVSHAPFAQGFGDGGSFDGMGVDACGNVYVCEYGPAKIWRIPPSGQGAELVVDIEGTGWIPNMQWGSGVGGWDPLVLYVLNIGGGTLYEVPVGVPSKPRKYP